VGKHAWRVGTGLMVPGMGWRFVEVEGGFFSVERGNCSFSFFLLLSFKSDEVSSRYSVE
jgi:hypothetical protein